MESINHADHPMSPSPEASCERSDTLWFKDGNIVLQTRTKRYRVHQSVLGVHSSVFRDMFGIPQPDQQKLVDGCPVVDVTDPSEEWDILLGLMYGLNDMFVDDDGFMHIPFATLRAALVLGTKYDCGRYRTTALHQLQKFFPQTLYDWDAAEEFRDYYKSYVFDLLELALSFGDRAMLPLAYYTCISQCDMSDIVQHHHNEEDHSLPFHALQTLTLSQQRMVNAQRDILLKWCWDGTLPSPECQSRAACGRGVSVFFRGRSTCLRGASTLLNPLGYMARKMEGVCTVCRSVAFAEHENARQLAWDGLAKLFGL